VPGVFDAAGHLARESGVVPELRVRVRGGEAVTWWRWLASRPLLLPPSVYLRALDEATAIVRAAAEKPHREWR